MRTALTGVQPVLRAPLFDGDAAAPPANISIAVLFTTPDGTRAALKSAAAFSRSLRAVIRLIVLEVVPYPLPLSDSPRRAAFWRQLLDGLAAAAKTLVSTEIYHCRDTRQGLAQLFSDPRLFVLGGRKSWWPGREQRLARWLARRGHSVIFIPAALKNGR